MFFYSPYRSIESNVETFDFVVRNIQREYFEGIFALITSSIRVVCFESFVSGLLNDESINKWFWRYSAYLCGFILRLGLLYAGGINLARSIKSDNDKVSDIVRQVIVNIYIPALVVLIITEMGNQTSLNRQRREREAKENADKLEREAKENADKLERETKANERRDLVIQEIRKMSGAETRRIISETEKKDIQIAVLKQLTDSIARITDEVIDKRNHFNPLELDPLE